MTKEGGPKELRQEECGVCASGWGVSPEGVTVETGPEGQEVVDKSRVRDGGLGQGRGGQRGLPQK